MYYGYKSKNIHICMINHVDGLVQERRNSIAYALGLRLSCSNPPMWMIYFQMTYCDS